ncbi:nucleoside triphosphate hydrolase protein [Favolaschia claudopus]|uniref:DNA 3'-5' helicase n=1 Tax=Favolaschia claudopus TaxID=2862362 RepID=A0AAV9ZAA6_9AGAR
MEDSAMEPPLAELPVNSWPWLDTLLRQKCGILSLHPHQLDHSKDLVDGRDLFLVIATGQGKSVVLYAPLIAAQARQERGLAFMVVPTKILAVQLANVGRKYGLRVLAINEDTVREAHIRERRDLFEEFAGGSGISVGVMSPQMLQGRRVGKLLGDPKFRAQVRWMLIDEAHVLNEESGTFREPYRGILNMRARLPTKTIWAAVTGTATPSAALLIAAALGFRAGQYVNARYSVDRPNIKYIPRFFQHPVSGSQFLDLSFVVPIDMITPYDIILTLIFVKTIKVGYALMKFFDSLLPSHLPNRLSIIKLYNALMPVDYRRKFVEDLNDGSTLRIGIVTDTCTYGTDIPKLARVIIAHIGDSMEDSPEVSKQQMGRAGRDGSPAVAVVYAPAWVRDVSGPDSEITTKQGLTDLERRNALPPVTRKFFNPTEDCCSRAADLEYNGEDFILRPGCCSLHESEPEESCDLAMVARWVEHFRAREEAERRKTVRSDGTYKPLDPILKASLTRVILAWRARKYNSLRSPTSTGGGSVSLLPQRLVDRVVDRAHACTSLDRLWGVLHDWKHVANLGEELFELLSSALPQYAGIISDRNTEGPMEVDSLPPPSASTPAVEPAKLQPMRIKIPAPKPTETPKRKLSIPSSPKTTQKRAKAADKENLR